MDYRWHFDWRKLKVKLRGKWWEISAKRNVNERESDGRKRVGFCIFLYFFCCLEGCVSNQS